MKKMLLGILIAALLSSAHASTYTGQVLTLQIAASSTAPDTVRISAQILGTTGCTNGAWYSAEFANDSALGKAWIAALLAAQARGANVTIGGTATCDSFGIESIHYINAIP